MIPGASEPYVFWEHVYRYHFAVGFAGDRSVVDVACGDGYGTAAIKAAGARRAIGIDSDPAVVSHAQARYGVDARVGSAVALPLSDETVDLVVSFETIEHLTDPAEFIRECHRVLVPDGTLIISTPNREVYTPGEHHNQFHLSERTETKFSAALTRWFDRTSWYGQCPIRVPWWSVRKAFTDGAPWMTTRLGRLVRQVLQRTGSRHYRYTPRPEHRVDPVHVIRISTRPGGEMVIPFAVYPRRSGDNDRPPYLIAVARKKQATG